MLKWLDIILHPRVVVTPEGTQTSGVDGGLVELWVFFLSNHKEKQLPFLQIPNEVQGWPQCLLILTHSWLCSKPNLVTNSCLYHAFKWSVGRERVAVLCSCQATHCLRQSEIISQPYSSPALLIRKFGSSQNSNKCCPSVQHMDVTLASLDMLPPSCPSTMVISLSAANPFFISLPCIQGCY